MPIGQLQQYRSTEPVPMHSYILLHAHSRNCPSNQSALLLWLHLRSQIVMIKIDELHAGKCYLYCTKSRQPSVIVWCSGPVNKQDVAVAPAHNAWLINKKKSCVHVHARTARTHTRTACTHAQRAHTHSAQAHSAQGDRAQGTKVRCATAHPRSAG